MAAGGTEPSRVRCAYVVLHRAVAQAVRWGWQARNPVSHATRPEVPRTTISLPSAKQVSRDVLGGRPRWRTQPDPPPPVDQHAFGTQNLPLRRNDRRLGGGFPGDLPHVLCRVGRLRLARLQHPGRLAGTLAFYYLNRNGAWGRTGRFDWWREVVPFWALNGVSLVFSTWAADFAQAHAMGPPHVSQMGVVWGAYVAAFGVLWIGKFLTFNRLFLSGHPSPRP